MSNKMLSITVQGKRCKWTFEFMGDPKYLEEWRADELHIEEVCNIIPEWVASAGLVKPWCFLQDAFNFKNPWSKK